MAKVATEKTTRTATKQANDKKTRPAKAADTGDKPKREPTAYQLFCKARMKEWNEQNPGRAKEAMAHMARLWKDAPENPNRGGEAKPKAARKPKEPKEPKEAKPKAAPKEKGARSKTKEKPASKAKSKPKKKDVESDDEEDEAEDASEEGSDPSG